MSSTKCITCKNEFTIKTLTMKNRNGKCGKCFNAHISVFNMNELNDALNFQLNEKLKLDVDSRECVFCKNNFNKNTGGMYIQPYISDHIPKNACNKNMIRVNTPMCKIINYDIYKCKKCINNDTPEYIYGDNGKKYFFTFPIKIWFEY